MKIMIMLLLLLWLWIYLFDPISSKDEDDDILDKSEETQFSRSSDEDENGASGGVKGVSTSDDQTDDQEDVVRVGSPGTTIYHSPETDSTKNNGQSCSNSSECTSGYCVDGFCCNISCSGTCQRCDAYDGTAGICHNVNDNHDPDSECQYTSWSCNGQCQRKRGDGYCDGNGSCDTNDYVESIPSGSTCTGNGVVSEVSPEYYCYYGETCVSGNCTGTQWFTSCDGSGSCRSSDDQTDSYLQQVVAEEGYTLTDNCGTDNVLSCNYGEFSMCNDSLCQQGREVMRCAADGSCSFPTGELDWRNCPPGTACSSGQCEAENVCNDTYSFSIAYGDDNYARGGSFLCQAGCDGSGTCDYATHCEQHFKVINLAENLDAVRTDSWIVDVGENPQLGDVEIGVKEGDLRVAEFDVEFVDEDLNWEELDAGVGEGKAFFHYPGGFSDLPGSRGGSYSLYVRKGLGDQVAICPNAQSVEDVGPDCEGLFYVDELNPNVEVVMDGGVEYWKVSGLTGTGAFSLVGIKDTMTRLQVSTASNHDIQFTTTYAINSSGDTITVDFVPNQTTTDGTNDFDFNGIGIDDIDLEDDGADKTLAASAGSGVWGVNIDSTNDVITFTAPTDAGATEIASNSVVHIKIGTNTDTPSQGDTLIINPDNVGEYDTQITLDNGTDIDFGELSVPIIDDDTVNVTGYVDTVLSFDIDTATTDVDCDAAGGTSPCDSHSGASDDAGYVVDLGEMLITEVRNSGDTGILHADGLTGTVNSIWMDIETNADSGGVVTVISANQALYKDASNEIPSVPSGSEYQITGTGSGYYGLNHPSGFVSTATSGFLNIHGDCDCTSGDDYYCDLPQSAPVEILNTNGNPVQGGRVQWAIGASPDIEDGTGTYTDQLTFIATSTF